MKLSTGEIAKLFGVSARTLRYYDEIGLLKPAEVSESGYRYYGGDELDTLQQLLFYRELGFPLREIAAMFQNPDYDRARALESHRELLELKKRRLEELIRLVDDTLGGKIMTKPNTTLDDIRRARQQYADEARERWGGTPEYEASLKKRDGLTADDELAQAREADEIFEAFSKLRGGSAGQRRGAGAGKALAGLHNGQILPLLQRGTGGAGQDVRLRRQVCRNPG